jgi:glycosyltransferase involved in cell wall biosynthesis
MKIGLCMIVKDESHVILESLSCTLPLIDTYCIVDTGSSDDTIEKIKTFYSEKGIEGIVHQSVWKDFGTNRSEALKLCDGMMDYILVIDADDLMEFPANAKQILEETITKTNPNALQIIIRQGDLRYYRAQFFKANDDWKYVGILHEYPTNSKESVVPQLPNEFWMESRRLGGRNKVGNKAQRDVDILTKGIVDEPHNERYYFYLAQSHRDNGNDLMAVKYYKERFKMGKWAEEAWFAAYQVGDGYKRLGNIHKFEYWMQKAYAYRPSRAEPIYKLVEYYRVTGKLYKAYEYYLIGSKIPYPKDDLLFIEGNIYNGMFDYEGSIIEYYVKRELCLATTIRFMLKSSAHQQNCVSNLQFSVKQIPSTSKPLNFQNPFGEDFRPSAVSLLKYPVANVRFINYLPPTNGEYKTKDGSPIQTNNAFVNLETGVSIPMKNPVPLFSSNVRGVEDLRIYQNGYNIEFIGTNYYEYEEGKISMVNGTYNLVTRELENVRSIKSPTNSSCEKNWLRIPDSDNFIYGWNPLRILNNKFEIIKTVDTPPLFSLFRGSAPPIEWNDVWLTMVHFVEYSNPRKYYHCFVELCKSYNVLRVSLPFFFKSNTIEYCISTTKLGDNITCYVTSNDSNPSEFVIKYSDIEFKNIN